MKVQDLCIHFSFTFKLEFGTMQKLVKIFCILIFDDIDTDVESGHPVRKL